MTPAPIEPASGSDLAVEASSNEGPAPDEGCPVCGHVPEHTTPFDYCDECGCLLVDAETRALWADTPSPIIEARPQTELEASNVDPYRANSAAERLDVVVRHQARTFGVRTASVASFFVFLALKLDLPVALAATIIGLVVLGVAWTLIPRPRSLRIVANDGGLTTVREGVPLGRGVHHEADGIEGVFVRALARADRPEDRRLELIVLDDHGGVHTILRGVDDPYPLLWIAIHVERALGFEDA